MTRLHWMAMASITAGMTALACAPYQSCGEGTYEDEDGYCRANGSTSSGGSSSGSSGADMGEPGGPCYGNGTCNFGLSCQSDVCQPNDQTGKQGGACYPNSTCNAGLACINDVCLPDTGSSSSSSSGGTVFQQGDEGGTCFANGTCLQGLYCVSGGCTAVAPVGAINGTCYPNSTCDQGLSCTAGTCRLDSASSSSSGGGSSSGGMAMAAQFFEDNVRQSLQTFCAACHESARSGPDFLGTGATTYYDSIVAYGGAKFLRYNPSQSSDLVLKGLHAGPALNAANGPPSDRQNVISWLEMEATERGIMAPGGGGSSSSSGGGGVVRPAVTAAEAISWFRNCMSRLDFDADAAGTNTSYADVPRQNTTEGRCYACHTVGAGGAFLSLNPDDMFYALTQAPATSYILKLALPSPDASGNYTMISANRYRDHGSEPGTHPRYVLNANREAAVNQLVDRTRLRFENNTDNCRAGP